jgi:hypothetical protein
MRINFGRGKRVAREHAKLTFDAPPLVDVEEVVLVGGRPYVVRRVVGVEVYVRRLSHLEYVWRRAVAWANWLARGAKWIAKRAQKR